MEQELVNFDWGAWYFYDISMGILWDFQIHLTKKHDHRGLHHSSRPGVFSDDTVSL
jgi:hypothetical protein